MEIPFEIVNKIGYDMSCNSNTTKVLFLLTWIDFNPSMDK